MTGDADRDQALSALITALNAIEADGDPARALADELTALARDLADASPDIDHDMPARQAIGRLHFLRSKALPGEPSLAELKLALAWLGPTVPGIPEELRRLVEAYDPVAAQARQLLVGYGETRSLPTLRQAIALFRQALAANGPDDPSRGVNLLSLGFALQHLFDHTEDLAVLREAVEVLRDAVAAQPDRDGRIAGLSLLVVALSLLFTRTRDVTVLREAIQAGRDEIAARPPGAPELAVNLGNLADLLADLSAHTGDVDVLREAVAVHRRGMAEVRPGDPDRGMHLSDFGVTLLRLHESTGDPETLREAVRVARDAVAAFPPDRPGYAACPSHLSVALLRSYEAGGEPSLLREAARIGRHAVAAVPPGDPARPVCLANLALVLVKLFESDGDLSTGREAVRTGRDAVAAAPPGHPDRMFGLANLTLALFKLFERDGDPSIGWEAVRIGREAVALAPPRHRDHALCLSAVAVTLRLLFERTGDLPALRESVRTGRDAVTATPPGHNSHGAQLANLGIALTLLFRHTGDEAVLREAAQTSRDAVTATPPGHSDRAKRLANLGTVLLSLARPTGQLALLREAVQIAREAVAATPVADPERAKALAGLGNALLQLFLRTSDIATLRESVQAGRDALAATPRDHPERALYLSNLGLVLIFLASHTGEVATSREAAQAAGDAVAAVPAEHPLRATYLLNLTNALRTLFERTGDLASLREAYRTGQDLLAVSPPDHPDHAAHLLAQARTSLDLAGRTGDIALTREARSLATSAAGHAHAPAVHRISAARIAADLALSAGDAGEASALIESVVELLPRLSSRDLGRPDREHRLGGASGLASTAAAVAIAAGRPGRAVELLEQTRGLVLAGTLDTRSDLTDLYDRAPGLAERLDELRRAIDAADHEPDLPTDADQSAAGPLWPRELAARRARLDQRWHDLLAEIRNLRDFAGFLRPPPVDELRRQAARGPIVYVTVHGLRGHALIVVDDAERPVRVVELPHGLTEQAAVGQAGALREAHEAATDPDRPSDERRAAQRRVLDVLAWLWDTVTEPVLRHLGHTGPPRSASWPRIWWCPVGAITFLPLHAAGRHQRDRDDTSPRTDTVMDRVVSSYTPTIRALAHACPHRPAALAQSMVIVAVPDAPGASPLGGVAREARLVHDLVPAATVLPPEGGRATRDTVTAALREHTIAHLACHGVADLADPTASRLILHDHLTAPLTLHAITRLRLTDAHLAYLSACRTTETTSDQADEATHITAAFQLAGYRHVVGTLWPINDQVAIAVAQDVYAQLTRDGARPPDPAVTAYALHFAIRRLRDRYPALPTRWAAHVHTGA